VAKIGAADGGSAVVFVNGTIKMWGNGAVEVPPFQPGEVADIKGGSDAFVALLTNGTVVTLGRGYILSDNPVPNFIARKVTSMSVADHIVMAVLDDGSLRMWPRYEVR